MKTQRWITMLAGMMAGVLLPALHGQIAPLPSATNTVTQTTTTTTTTTTRRPPIEYVDADLRDVVRALARQAGMNVIVGEDVTGKVTTRLVDVPIEQALKIILESKGYVLTYGDGVYQVRSKASIANEPTETRIVTLKNTSTKNIEPIMKQLISRQGKIQTDERSSSVIVTDTPTALKTLVPIIEALDTPTPQVMIEFRLLETTKNPILNTGIDWSGLYDNTITLATPGGVTGYAAALINAGGGIHFIPGAATLSANELSATFNYLIQNTDTELLANPRVVTTDNTPAQIKIIDEEPIPNFQFNSTTASFVLSGFDYKNIGATLKVTPHVNKDQFVTLDLVPEFTSRAGNRTFILGAGAGSSVTIPVVATRNIESRVVIKSGETLALGGLIQKNGDYTYTKVPILGDIPLLGYAFKSSDKSKTKKNLLFFITPTIIPSGGKTGLEDQYAQLKGERADDFADNRSWLGNGKGYQIIDFGDVADSKTPEEYDFEYGSEVHVTGPNEKAIPTTSAEIYRQRQKEKERALKAASEYRQPIVVAPRLTPRLR
jgi:type IV pilus assembly protein PilQ